MTGPLPLDRTRAIPLAPTGGAADPLPLPKSGALPLHVPPKASPRNQLRSLSHQLEGVFLNQLFQAMRATVPQSEDRANEGEQLFTSMLDEKLSAVAAERMQRGIGEALYKELARRLPQEGQP